MSTLRIFTDETGSIASTLVYIDEKPVTNVSRVELVGDANGLQTWQATVTFDRLELDITAQMGDDA